MSRRPSDVQPHPSAPTGRGSVHDASTHDHTPAARVRALPVTAPRPHPSRGAGGPPRRAAGWVSCEPLAVVLGGDDLRAHLLREALLAAGFSRIRHLPASERAAACAQAHLVVVDLAEPAACRRLPRLAAQARPVTAGYVAGRPLSLLAHAAHGCVDLLLELAVIGGRPLLQPVDPATGRESGLTPREADVLALVLGGLTDRQIAAELTVSPATARSHVRSLLRRLGAVDRTGLRRRDRLL